MTSSANAPLVSVIMPIRNEADTLRTTLKALIGQTRAPQDFEIIVADGNSSDETPKILEDIAERQMQNGLIIRAVKNPKATAASGLNQAILAARGQILVRVDGHTQVAEDYLEMAEKALKDSGAECVGGPQLAVSDRLWGRAYALATRHVVGHGGAAFRDARGQGEVDTVYLGVWPRSTFEHYGLFNESLGKNQDDEFHMRIRKGGGRVVLDPRIRSSYRPRETWSKIAKQYFLYGWWKPRVLSLHPTGLKLRHLAPLGLILSGLFLMNIGPKGAAPLFALIYALAMVVASCLAAKRGGALGLWPAVGVVMVTIHVSYGLGSLMGLPFILFGSKSKAWPHLPDQKGDA